MVDIWGSNKKRDDDEADFSKNIEKRRQEREILREYNKERKLRAIEKIQKVLDLPLFDDYDDSKDLNTFQRLVILQLLRKIGECEGKIPKEFWCDSCKRKEKRVKELIKKFRNILRRKSGLFT